MKVKKSIKFIVRNFFEIMGFSLIRISEVKDGQVDVRKDTNSYRKIFQYGKPVIVKMPIEKLKWKALGISFDYCHPFVFALKKSCEESQKVNFEILCGELIKYYELVQPQSMSDCLDFEIEAEFPKPQHTHHTRWPWIDNDSNKIEVCPVIQKNKIRALSSREHGVQHWGPVSHVKMLTEAIKLSRLYDSITEKGYQSHVSENPDSMVRVYILEKENLEWVAVPFQGQHRVSVASALNIQAIPVKVMFVIRRVDVELFPLVTKGIFSEEDALRIFDSFFEERRPKVLNRWYNYLSSKTSAIHSI